MGAWYKTSPGRGESPEMRGAKYKAEERSIPVNLTLVSQFEILVSKQREIFLTHSHFDPFTLTNT